MSTNLPFSLLYFFTSAILSVSQPVSPQVSNSLWKDGASVLKGLIFHGKRPLWWVEFSKFPGNYIHTVIFSSSIKQVRNHILLALHSLPPNREAVFLSLFSTVDVQSQFFCFFPHTVSLWLEQRWNNLDKINRKVDELGIIRNPVKVFSNCNSQNGFWC